MTIETASATSRGLTTEDHAPTPAYMSFTGFRSLLDRLGNEGLPQVFDRSFFGEYSGSLIAQIRGTFRFLDLIDEDKRPTDQLRAIIDADEQGRIALLRKVAEEKYASALALGADATQGQLAEVFRVAGLSGESLTKAINFYVGLADYVNLPVSPFFKRPTVRVSTGSGNGPRRTSSRRRKPSNVPVEPPAAQGQQSVSPIEEKRSAYIDLLMKLAEQSGANGGEVQQDLLNRLERALGYESSP